MTRSLAKQILVKKTEEIAVGRGAAAAAAAAAARGLKSNQSDC